MPIVDSRQRVSHLCADWRRPLASNTSARWLDAGGDEDVVGGEAGGESGEDAPHDDFGEALAAGDFHELDDDVEDRTGGEREEREEHGVVDEGFADECSEEGRPAADDAHGAEEAP